MLRDELFAMKKYILTIYDKDLPQLKLPPKWEVLKVASFSEGLKVLNSVSPSILLLQNTSKEGEARNFLKEISRKFGLNPPAIVWGVNRREELSEEEMSSLGIISSFEGEPKFREILKEIEPLLKEPPLPNMTTLEILAYCAVDEMEGIYELKFSKPFCVVLKQGKIEAILDERFREIYRNFLIQGGLTDLPERDIDLLKDFYTLEALPFVEKGKIKEVKKQAIIQFLSTFPLDSGVKFSKVSDVLPPFELIDVEPLSIIRVLIEKISTTHLEVLKKCSFKKSPFINPSITLLPDEGYILHFLENNLEYKEIVKSIGLSESTILRKIYLLFILNFISSYPIGGNPNSILQLTSNVKTRERKIMSQSIAIEQFAISLQTPGLSPYQVLGINPTSTLSEALEAYKYLQNLFSLEGLEPSIQKEYAKHLTLIRSKLTEAFLLIQNLHLNERQKVMDKAVSDLGKVSHIGAQRTKTQEIEEGRKKEALRIYNIAKELLENDIPYDACQYLKTALIYDPFSAPCRHLLGITYLKLKGARSKYVAEKELKLAVEYDPWNVTYLMDLAKLYIEENMPNRAKGLIEQASRIDANSEEVKEVKELLKRV